MRLIDADLLKKNIAKWLQGSDPQETEMVRVDDIAVSVIMEIDEQPTAYDVEKVVEQLEEWTFNADVNLGDDTVKNSDLIASENAIDIVKRGGVNDD